MRLWLYSMPMVWMVVTLNRSAINSRAIASDRHIRQLAHINLTGLPSLSGADRSKTLVRPVRQVAVARPSFVASLVVILAASRTPVPVSSVPLSRRLRMAMAWAARCRCSVCSPCLRQPRTSVTRCSKGAARRRHFKPQSAGPVRGPVRSMAGRSVCQRALYLHFDAERNKFAAPSVIATLAGIAETGSPTGRSVAAGRPTVLRPSIARTPGGWRGKSKSERTVDGRTDGWTDRTSEANERKFVVNHARRSRRTRTTNSCNSGADWWSLARLLT